MAEQENDHELVDAALRGDADACAQIGGEETTRWLWAVLMKRGASGTEGASSRGASTSTSICIDTSNNSIAGTIRN